METLFDRDSIALAKVLAYVEASAEGKVEDIWNDLALQTKLDAVNSAVKIIALMLEQGFVLSPCIPIFSRVFPC